MGNTLPYVVPPNFMGNGELAGQVSKIVSIWAGLWLWGLAMWFCIVSIGAHWSCVRKGRMTFAMTFYSYVFPNTALTTATFAIANALASRGINILGCVMSILVVLTWITVFGLMIRAVVVKDILWPQRQEDREEGGWKTSTSEVMAGHVQHTPDHDRVHLRLRTTPSSTLAGPQSTPEIAGTKPRMDDASRSGDDLV
jgi:hypothetical protein